jgi:hypothetical protein
LSIRGEVYVDMPNGKRKVCPAATDSMPTLLDMIDNNNNVIFVISDCTAWHCRHLQYIVKAQKRRLVKGMTISSILPAAIHFIEKLELQPI